MTRVIVRGIRSCYPKDRGPMARAARITQIKSSDFEAFVSDVAAGIWNQLIEKPPFNALRPRDFPDIFEAVAHTLSLYKVNVLGIHRHHQRRLS